MTSTTVPLVTIAEIEVFAPVTNSGADATAIEAQYTTFARLATQQIEKYCRLTLLREVKTQYFPTKSTMVSGLNLSGTDNSVFFTTARVQKIYLEKINIDMTQPFLVYYDPLRLWGSETLVADTEYFVDAVNGSLTLEFGTVFNPKALKVVYTGGFASAGTTEVTLSASAPDDLKMACINQVIFMYNVLASQDIGTQLREKRNRLFVRPGFMTDNAMQLIQPYKRLYTGRYA